MNTTTLIGAWASALAGLLAFVSPDTGARPQPVAASGGTFFTRTVEFDGSQVADTSWNIPPAPEGVRHYDVILDIEGQDGFIAGSPGVLRLTAATVEARLSNGARLPMSVGQVTGLTDEYGIPYGVVGTGRVSLLPPESQTPVLVLEWDTVAANLFPGSGLSEDLDYTWTITVEVVPVFDV